MRARATSMNRDPRALCRSALANTPHYHIILVCNYKLSYPRVEAQPGPFALAPLPLPGSLFTLQHRADINLGRLRISIRETILTEDRFMHSRIWSAYRTKIIILNLSLFGLFEPADAIYS